ncbi:MAG: hypothetical protein ABIW84_04510 [Ilumatobacteraceae bacterium]
MTQRLLAAATMALQESGSRERPLAAARIGVVGEFRRQMFAIIVAIVSVPFASRVFGLDSRPYLIELLAQIGIALTLIIVLVVVLSRTLRGDPVLLGARSGMVVITDDHVRLFASAGRRRFVPALSVGDDDLVFAHIEPRRSMFDVPRFVFGHLGGAMSYELQGKDLLQLNLAIERLGEQRDR